MVNELIAVPFGATPTITVTSFTSTDYKLADYGIHRLMPRQPSLRKDQRPEEVPFVYNEAAYQTRGMRSEPQAFVSVEGTMRGVRLGKMTIEPVSYDPVNNTLRVFNNIEVEVRFEGADAAASQQVLLDTYSPYFDVVYAQLFNGRAILDAYTDHPDLYTTPVKMMVITTSTYANSTAFQNWVTWKKQKGIYVDVFTTNQTGSTASAIKSFIQTQYNQNHPTFLVIVGDTGDVTYSLSSSTTSKVTDLYYSSPDGDLFPDIFTSRMPVSSVTELGNLVNKILTYEKYTMTDPSYLSKVLLIAGSDATWNPRVGQPTINYAADNYFNTAHGFTNVYKYLSSYTNCYSNMNTGIGFANYTAHGGETGWSGPSFSVSDANNLTNNDKYFWAMGNCCLAANWGYSGTCLAEALLRAANKGAFGYIGSCPETYWWEDYYFGVGATTTINTTPAMSNTKTGTYDAMFMDDMYNTLNSVPFLGNVAVTYAHAGSYSYSVTDTYYWEAYHCLGDGSVMPYHVNPSANQVSHAPTLGIGLTTFTVNALPGSYVSITKDNEILGVAQVGTSGTVDVPITPVTGSGEVMIVVTRQQRQPYITTIPTVALEGPYMALDGYTPTTALIGENTPLSLTFKNVGVDASVGTTNVTLTSDDPNVQINGSGSFGALAPDATATVNGFSFSFNNGIALGTAVVFHYTAVNGSNTWEGIFTISPDQIFTVTVAVNNADYGSASGGGEYHYGQPCTVNATPAEGYMFTGWVSDGSVVSTNASYTFDVIDNTDLVANFAEGVMIGSGTTTNVYLPSYSYYKYSLTEQLYTPAELGGPGFITSIAFYNSGAQKTRTYDFYMKATSKDAFSGSSDWITVSADDKVFSGSVTMVADDWTTIVFSTPFVYDGTSNVVLVADDNTGDYTNSPHMACRVFSATSQAIRIYSDGSNYNPFAPTSYSGTVLSEKNQLIVTKSSIDGCINSTPTSVVVDNITGTTAHVTWTGLSESYHVCLGIASIVTVVEDFTESIPAAWNNSSDYPWTIVNGHMQSSNAGVASSTSTISATGTYAANGTIEFDAECKGEGTSSIWDKCIFLIDGVQQFSYGANVSGWKHYSYDVTAGEHTFTWTYSKDGSVDPTGDYFAVDNVTLMSSEVEWGNPIAVGDMEYTLRNLSPETTYCVRVQGICEGVVSAWSETVMFTTGEGTPDTETETQTLTLSPGWNWFSCFLAYDEDLVEALLEAIAETNSTAVIKSMTSNATLENGTWSNTLTFENETMFMICLENPVTLELTAPPADPAEHPITLAPGWNWIPFLGNAAMTLQEALSSLTPNEGDVIKSNSQNATYANGQGWSGSLTTLAPSLGYMYLNNGTTSLTLTYPMVRQKNTVQEKTAE